MSDTPRTPPPMEQWLLQQIDASPTGVYTCQILWAFGQASNGEVSKTAVPGIYVMRAEGQDQRGQRHRLQRYFTIETVMMIDVLEAQRIQPVILPVG